MQYKPLRILVTGGAGFIGSNFIRYWLKKYPKSFIVNLDRLAYSGNLSNLKGIKDNYKFIKGDIARHFDVAKAIKGVDTVVNFAAQTHVDRSIYGPLQFIKTNVLGAAVLLEAARKEGVKRFIHVSTDEVFGELPLRGNAKFKETTKYLPRSPYSASKAGSDHLVYAYWATYGMHAITTNCSNNLGPYQYPEKFIPLAITNVLDGKPIRVYGKGENKRDWIYVLDHCRGVEAAIERGNAGETYLFGGRDGAKFNNLEIAKLILLKMGKPRIIKKEEDDPGNKATIHLVADRPGHDLRYDIDWSKSKKELKWRPRYGIKESLDLTIKWYKDNQRWWRPLKKKRVIFSHGENAKQ